MNTLTNAPPTKLDRTRSVMGWVIVPAILSIVVGIYVNYKITWLNPLAVGAFLMSIVPLYPVFTAKRLSKVNWKGVFWLIAHVLLFGWAGYLEWAHLGWPWSPWFGFGAMVVVWLIVVLVISIIIGMGHENTPTQTHSEAQVSTIHPDQALKVTQTLAAKLGLPIGSGAEVDLGELTQALKSRASADVLEADAAARRETREALQWALANNLINPSEITDRVRYICGINPPPVEVKPERPPRSSDWRGLYVKSKRRL